ncbi:ABC transporter substrate-binding protein [Parapedobacter sp. DT-150]|uniref:ABC transporter substrate-binding protein n=1 Tax=Parapedobacter sp. DT-150 TaxID=3396162 RepID=UPI003F198B05
MTLVRNLRLRLNGSSWLIGIAALLLMTGCTPKIRVLRGSGSKTEPKETETKPADQRAAEVEEPITESEKTDVRNIALLLPFQLDKANPHAPSAADIKRSALALDFYQGFKLGLDALAEGGTHFKVNVLDTRDDPGENARIAKLEEVQGAALVVGPVFPKEIQVFGFNASLDDALQISPLAASMPSEFNLPNLVTLTAPITAHVNALAAHIVRQYRAGDAVIFYNTGDEASRQFLAPLKTEIRRLNSDISLLDVQDEESLESNVRLTGKNLIMLGTTNEYQLSPILTHLRTLQDELSYQIQVFGHPNWAKMDFDESEGLGALQARVTTSYYVRADEPDVRRFVQLYRQEFGMEPTEFAYKGYDAAYYFGGLLAEYGPAYKDQIVKQEYTGLHNTFKFTYDPAWGYVNNAISILQYRSGQFQPLD